jgi:hypothetical protein
MFDKKCKYHNSCGYDMCHGEGVCKEFEKKCVHDKGYCKVLSDSEVKQPCIEGPCKDYLLSCPFCGKSHIIIDTIERQDRPACKWRATVFCANCFGEASNHGFDWTEEKAKRKAIEAWNRRA